jgi:hypothetical protein
MVKHVPRIMNWNILPHIVLKGTFMLLGYSKNVMAHTRRIGAKKQAF